MALAEARLPGQILDGKSAVQMRFDMRHKTLEDTLGQDRWSLGDHFTRMELTLEHPRGQGRPNALDKACGRRKRSSACFPKRLSKRPKASVQAAKRLKVLDHDSLHRAGQMLLHKTISKTEKHNVGRVPPPECIQACRCDKAVLVRMQWFGDNIARASTPEIGRASCRERVENSVVAE